MSSAWPAPASRDFGVRVRTRVEGRVVLWKLLAAFLTFGLTLPMLGVRKRTTIRTTRTII